MSVSIFFFQAEDGIRDTSVTGVQTCALPISVKNPDARKISDAMMRCLAKCIATFGIGLYVYAGEDVPHIEEEPVELEPMLESIWMCQTLEELREIYITAVKSVKGNQDALRQLESMKDKRKQALMEVGINE